MALLKKNSNQISFFGVNLDDRKEKIPLLSVLQKEISKINDLGLNLQVDKPYILYSKHKFNQLNLLSIEFLLSNFIHKKDDLLLELRDVVKYVEGLILSESFLFLELTKVFLEEEKNLIHAWSLL